MTKILVDVDERVLAQAAARLGATTKNETEERALELTRMDSEDAKSEAREWAAWADRFGERLNEVDCDAAWSRSHVPDRQEGLGAASLPARVDRSRGPGRSGR